MSAADLTAEHFHNDEAARKFLESVRWPDGPICPHCGTVGHAYENASKPGIYRCASSECRKDFSITVGTLFERSHIPLHKWLLATHLMMSSKKGVSAHHLHRMLGITYKSAWFMAHRLREALADQNPGPMGGEGKVIEADETYYGPGVRVAGRRKKRQGTGGKAKIITLVERDGRARSFKVDAMNAATVRKVLLENASRESILHTDESGLYPSIGLEFAKHRSVMYSAEEYVKKDDPSVHTNTIEGFFSIFKRGMKGVYQHCGEQHLQRYLTEFDFRYSNRKISDRERAELALKGIEGKRLTYRPAHW